MELIEKKVLFIDLDGTIRYSTDPKTEFPNLQNQAIFPEIPSILKKFQEEGWLISIITNQGGVAFGYKTEKEFDNELSAAFAMIDEQAGTRIDITVGVCYSMPNATVPKYKLQSLCRKPKAGLVVLQEIDYATKGFSIDYANSLFVGDRPEDYACALNAGIKFCDANAFRALPINKHTILKNYPNG